MANRKLVKVGKLRNLRKVFPSFLVSEFLILPYSQNRKLGIKNLGKKFPRFPRFPIFPSFRPGPCLYVNRLLYCNFYYLHEHERLVLRKRYLLIFCWKGILVILAWSKCLVQKLSNWYSNCIYSLMTKSVSLKVLHW